jgi:hypothetical protein
MAGTLVTDTLQDSLGNSTATTNAIKGSAKAWVTFNSPTTPNILGSFNVSSVTYFSTGNWTINFTTALPNTNYVAVGSNNGLGGSTNYQNVFGNNIGAGFYSVNACSMAVVSGSGSGVNTDTTGAVFFSS